MTASFPPPRSLEFNKFIEFVILLANPKELSKDLKQFKEASNEYIKAKKAYEDALKIAATVEEAESIKEANNAEASRLKVLNQTTAEQKRSVETLLAKKHEDFQTEATKTKNELEAEREELTRIMDNNNVTFNTQSEDLERREKILADGLESLKREKRIFKEKRTRVEQAYEAA